MINVVIWLGKIKYSADLAIVFARNNIRIVDENFENTDDFIDRFDSLDANVDVLVIADALLLGADRKKLFQRIRQIEPNIRIVIVFPGYRNQYIEDQISEYKNVYGISDIIYEGNRLDEDYFADVIKKGYIYDYEVNVYDEPGEESRVILPEKKCISIGILGFTHGCGVTNEVINTAGYISVTQNGNVKAIDFSGTGNLRFAKTKGVTYIVHSDIDIARIRKTSKAVVYDFGTPFNISSKGKLLSYNECYDEEKMKLFRECDLKVCKCFSDSWHIGKMKYFLNDKFWSREIDDSYIILLDKVPRDSQNLSSRINICGRNDTVLTDRLADLFDGEAPLQLSGTNNVRT